MKKSILTLAVATLVLFGCKSGEKHDQVFDGPITEVSPRPDGHTSENSLDWEGVYEATDPCADCDGIKTTVTLRQDKTFTMSQSYLGKAGGENHFNESGTFRWDENGSIVVLETPNLVVKLKVEENELSLSRVEGNVERKELGNFYVLKKQ